MTDDLAPIPLSRRWKVGGPRRACARKGCDDVFVGSVSTIYCSAECQEIDGVRGRPSASVGVGVGVMLLWPCGRVRD